MGQPGKITYTISPNRLHFHAQHRWQIAHDWIPAVPGVGGAIDLAAGGAKINSAFVERVHSHGVAQHVNIAVRLRQAFSERLPLVASSLAAINPQLAFVHVMLAIAL